MGKRRPKWDYDHYLRKLKEGHGQGTGADYKPWISIHDFPSQGVSARVLGNTTGRIHHLLSRNEEFYFLMLDYDPEVTDIREQFPLRLSETLEIAEKINVRHPWSGNFPFVMTTDFVINKGETMYARAVKESKELSNPRVMEKLSIEASYWESKEIDWKIVTEKEINRIKAKNLQWLHSGESAGVLIPDDETHTAARKELLSMIAGEGMALANAVEITEAAFDLRCGAALALYKELVLDGFIHPDLDSRLLA